MQKIAKTPDHLSHQAIKLDLTGLKAHLTVEGDTLHLTVPTTPLPPMLNVEAREALIAAGLDALEVDVLAEQVYEQVQDKLIAKLIASRRVR